MNSPMTILIVHNHYQQSGGEDQVFEAECAMLEAAGHTVIRYEKHNNEITAGQQGSGVRDLCCPLDPSPTLPHSHTPPLASSHPCGSVSIRGSTSQSSTLRSSRSLR